ncbi:TPA: hypothetical protein ACKRTC_001306 [Proteus mirabilis]|nr:hypothetical protein [Proteus mirabilis]
MNGGLSLHVFIIKYLVTVTRSFIITVSARMLCKKKTFSLSTKFISITTKILKKSLSLAYSSESATFLTKTIIKAPIKNFEERYIFSRLMVDVIRHFLIKAKWDNVNDYLEKQCLLQNQAEKEVCDFIFCTHTGDYWILILKLAKSFEGRNIDLVVPIYKKIDNEMEAIYSKIDILGVNVIFMCIHDDGALIKLSRYMKKKNVIIAVFYDLSCYISGVYNGAVDDVLLFGKKGFMTTGIIRIAYKHNKKISFASCHYSWNEKKFIVNISPVVDSGDTYSIKRSMVSYLECYLSEFPCQWHFINNLDTYFHYPYFQINQKNISNNVLLKRIKEKYLSGQRG